MNAAERLAAEIDEAESKAIDALGRYKFTMFGYWAGIWVHLNKIEGARRPSPFRGLVKMAKGEKDPQMAALVLKGQDVVEDFLPNIGQCALQDYGRLNDFMIDATALRKEVEA